MPDIKRGLGRQLARRRDEKDIPQREIIDALDLSQSYISKLEHGGLDKAMHRWKSDRIWTMLKAYRYSEKEAREIAGEYGLDVPAPDYPPIPPNASQGVNDGPKAWHMGVVSAGIDGKTKPSKPRLVNLPSWITAKYKAEDVFVLTVEGDSMTCDDIRKSIPEGSEVYFHKSLRPEAGEVIAVWLEDYDFGVIKVYKPNRTTSVLQSYNFKHQPILIDESNPAIIQGVYIGKSDPSPLRFNL